MPTCLYAISWFQLVKLTANDMAPDDLFGYSLSVSDSTMVVGAPCDGDKGQCSGSVYVLNKSGRKWIQSAKLTANDGAENDYFGISVASSGDTIVVGSYADDDNGASSGSAYVFNKTGGNWVQVAKLTASDGDADDSFGWSVAVNGDTIVIGAYVDEDNGFNSGSAYVFVKPVSGWSDMTQSAKLLAGDGNVGDFFGYSVSISGDDIVVGSVMAGLTGAAYVFVKPGIGWLNMVHSAKLMASDTTDNFGRSVAINNDTIIVGASGDDDNGDNSGSAYVFAKPGSGWNYMYETAKLTAEDGAAGDYFGDSVSISGNTIVIGAYGDDDNGFDSGSAYLFAKPGTGWSDMTQNVKLIAADGVMGDHFGDSIAIDGDTIIVGAIYDGEKSGSVYVFTPDIFPWPMFLPSIISNAD